MAPEPATSVEPRAAQASFEDKVDFKAFAHQAILRRSSRGKRKASDEPETSSQETPPLPIKKPRTAHRLKPPVVATTTSSISTVSSIKPVGKTKSAYSPPSKYAHLGTIPDSIGPDLLVIFVGFNPGEETARKGHAYANPSNRFWPFLFQNGLTPVRCKPEDHLKLPERYSLGLTNLVSRPTKTAAELSTEELCEGVHTVEDKVRRWRPEVVCFAGKGIWEMVWLVKHGKKITKKDFKYGFQDESENFGVVASDSAGGNIVEEGVSADPDWAGARVFVATTTSGLATIPTMSEKEANWRELGSWVNKRRSEREESKA